MGGVPSSRFLADINISPRTVEALTLQGWDIVRVSAFLPQTASDVEILAPRAPGRLRRCHPRPRFLQPRGLERKISAQSHHAAAAQIRSRDDDAKASRTGPLPLGSKTLRGSRHHDRGVGSPLPEVDDKGVTFQTIEDPI